MTMLSVREDEVASLRRKVQALEEVCAELMTPSGAANVLESWAATQVGAEYRELFAALRAVGKKEKWT